MSNEGNENRNQNEKKEPHRTHRARAKERERGREREKEKSEHSKTNTVDLVKRGESHTHADEMTGANQHWLLGGRKMYLCIVSRVMLLLFSVLSFFLLNFSPKSKSIHTKLHVCVPSRL